MSPGLAALPDNVLVIILMHVIGYITPTICRSFYTSLNRCDTMASVCTRFRYLVSTIPFPEVIIEYQQLILAGFSDWDKSGICRRNRNVGLCYIGGDSQLVTKIAVPKISPFDFNSLRGLVSIDVQVIDGGRVTLELMSRNPQCRYASLLRSIRHDKEQLHEIRSCVAQLMKDLLERAECLTPDISKRLDEVLNWDKTSSYALLSPVSVENFDTDKTSSYALLSPVSVENFDTDKYLAYQTSLECRVRVAKDMWKLRQYVDIKEDPTIDSSFITALHIGTLWDIVHDPLMLDTYEKLLAICATCRRKWYRIPCDV